MIAIVEKEKVTLAGTAGMFCTNGGSRMIPA